MATIAKKLSEFDGHEEGYPQALYVGRRVSLKFYAKIGGVRTNPITLLIIIA